MIAGPLNKVFFGFLFPAVTFESEMARYTAQKLPLHHALPPMLSNPTNVFEEKSGKELFSEGLETLPLAQLQSEEQKVFSVSLLRKT